MFTLLHPRLLWTALLLQGCLGYDPTTPPTGRVSFRLELPAEATAQVVIYDDSDHIAGAGTAHGGVSTEIQLESNRDYGGLRLVARSGEVVLKAVIPELLRTDRHDLGAVDRSTTTAAQLIQEKIAGQGGSFAAMPASVIQDLLTQIQSSGPEVLEFARIVSLVLDAAATGPEATEPAFGHLDALLREGFVAKHAPELPESIAADYRNALTAAIDRLEVSLICDAALIKVMFTVDLSGKALDGNGAPQLIRQATRSDHVFLAITADESSPVPDSANLLKAQMVPNDSDTAMVDDGSGGDEEAGDGVFTRVLILPRGMRVKYKYTNGSAGEGWTRTEEWPGNARILEIKDRLTRHGDGSPDCLVIRRDVFGDEATNKNFVNTNAELKASGGTLSFFKDLGGAPAAPLADERFSGGLELRDVRLSPPLSPLGLPEAAENGRCVRCPAPLTLSADDQLPPALVSAEFISTAQIKVSFTEAMEFGAASLPSNYLVLDGARRSLAIAGAASSGASVFLDVAAPDLGQTYTLHVKNLTDASANANPLAPEAGSITIGPDRTAPRISAVRPLPLRDYNPGATDADPTRGQALLATFSEELDPSTAENLTNYQIKAASGEDLPIHAAFLADRREVWLITDPQQKEAPYSLHVKGVRDLGGNRYRQEEPLAFKGFALYQITFGAVVGFAWLDLEGTQKGLPEGAGLYLTGTVLAVARDLAGNPIGVKGRTDLTGIPEFEMKPGSELYHGQPVYTLSVLAPPGSYAWKVAHGVPGEFKDPPPTLEKVHKSLVTATDPTGVNIDPVTLTALVLPDRDGAPVSYLDYSAAKISAAGLEPPGPFTLDSGQSNPRPVVMYKRENPDEVCVLKGAERTCTAIVVSTWRDLEQFVEGGKTNDYDDGLPEVDPVRIAEDRAAPRLVNLQVRDSESLLLSFDERLHGANEDLTLLAHDATDAPLEITLEQAGAMGSALLPHQVLLRTAAMDSGGTYTLTLSGVADVHGNLHKSPRKRSWTAPPAFQPFTPLADQVAPRVLAVLPQSPTSLLIQFSEKISPVSASQLNNFMITDETAQPLPISGAAVQGGGTAIQLSTGLQEAQASYTLTVRDIADLASPPNLLSEQLIQFKGFGDLTPPEVVYAAAISPSEVVVAFNEPLSPLNAPAPESYEISGLTVISAAFSGEAPLKAAAFSPAKTRYVEHVVVLKTSGMTPGQSYTLSAGGVTDLSGNACQDQGTFTGVASAPLVDVIMSYKISAADTVNGAVPARALNPADLAAQREGVFILGNTVSSDGLTKGPASDPINIQLGTFPAEGQPLDGQEPRLLDDGQGPDLKAGDQVYSIRISGVPLGTSLLWKAFAPWTTAYKQANPGDTQAAFADALSGPSVFADGQEFPGNENAVRILGDLDGDGVVRINNLFGDEVTYKKFTDSPAFVWVVDDHEWRP